MKRDNLLIMEKITLKLCCLRILAMEKLEFGKKGDLILLLLLYVITLKLCCLRILAMEKLEFGKKGNMILMLGLE